MPDHSTAEEHLRVIRGLMERATIYRAISAPGALVGGVFAVILAVVCWWLSQGEHWFVLPFALPWLVLLAVTSAANAGMLLRDARRRGDPFVSSGMKVALRAMLPGLLAGGLCTLIEGTGGPALTATLWVLCYGLSLLSASHFAPKSIQWLGRAFFIAGAGLLLASAFAVDHWRGLDRVAIAHLIMGLTFGVFHLAYAAWVWPRSSATARP